MPPRPDHDAAFRNRLLLDLGHRLAEASSEGEVARIILDAADLLIGWDAAFLDTYNADEGTLRPVLTFDLVDGQRRQMDPVTQPGPPSLFARTILEGKPILILREGEDDRQGALLVAFGTLRRRSLSLLYAPIRIHDRTVGFLSAQSYQREAYTQEDLEVLGALADHCGGALQRAWAEARLREAREEVLRELIAVAGAVAYETGAQGELMRFLGDPSVVLPGVLHTVLPAAEFQSWVKQTAPSASSDANLRLWRADQELALPSGPQWVNHTIIHSELHREGSFGVLLNITERKRLEERQDEERRQEIAAIREENRYLRRYLRTDAPRRPKAFAAIATVNRAMRAIFLHLESVAPTGRPLLILGETGTGKELLARAAHAVSGRTGRFVPCNVAGLDEEAFTDTLFGHAAGSFTGADSRRAGLVEQASGGTLFLDEIGDLPRPLQVKLLRLVQEQEYYPLGSDQLRVARCTIISATNANLEQHVADGRFREDLYYRLSTHSVLVPPLRERREDIPLIVRTLVLRHAEERAVPLRPPSEEALALLMEQEWPGNVRQLEGLVYDLLAGSTPDPWAVPNLASRLAQLDPPARGLTFDYMDFPPLRAVTDQLVEEALRRTGGNQKRAAALLGITQQSLSSRLQTKKRRLS